MEKGTNSSLGMESLEQIKIKGKKKELLSMITCLEYVAVTKTVLKYASYYVEVHSSFISPHHESVLSLHIFPEPDVPLTFYGSVIRFLIFVVIIEATKRFPFNSQKQINTAALVMFNLFSLIVFYAIG
jgi:hypothetical protein